MHLKKILTERIQRFPGIGKKQAERIFYFLSNQNPEYLEGLSRNISQVSGSFRKCSESFQTFEPRGDERVSPIAEDPTRKRDVLMIMASDTNLTAFEASNLYNGQYFVFGGVHRIIDRKNLNRFLREKQLLERVKIGVKEDGLSEIVFGFSPTTEGDYTSKHLMGLLEVSFPGLKFTMLGRGLAKGTEIEYTDEETLKSAWGNRFSY